MLDELDGVMLARAQFAFTITIHFLFPGFTIGLASYLAVLNWLWLRTRQARYLNLFNYWVKIFALAFAMGVVSGIVMSYEIGTNWATFADKAGPVIGPPMAYEVLSAFFLEAGFLGIMLFGRDRVGPGLHMFACAAVAVGTCTSAFWILSVNSWMQTPTGYTIDPATGRFLPVSFWLTVFNPSFPYRLLHTVCAAYLGTAFVIGGVGAWHLLKGRADAGAAVRTMFSMAMWMAAIVVPIQIVIGDQHGLNTLGHQPQKVMAMEGHFESHPSGAPLYLFGVPNERERRVDYAVAIPKLGSLILKHDINAPLAGLDTIPRDQQPPVAIVFWSFRVMVGLGLLMLALGVWGLWCRWHRTLYSNRALLWTAVVMSPAGLAAITAGWITTEVGRQPYTVFGLLRTRESVAPVSAGAVGATLIAFILVYFAVFGAGTLYMLRLMAKSPHTGEPGLEAATRKPLRAAGITPAPAMDPRTLPKPEDL
ncbi:cytochrome ubiquinol oxidase subunit I [Sphingomonas sp. H39-1-10]|uniref:cytochrome ubiquinol oxidase subunit I n=1 Tax=Sphingomonas TaxID=13687 RepID=UPI0008816FFE|nr:MULTISPECIES: cytochrome ubiquinol oxidase subunit I [Sphingomonas]MDF0489937.1 cytochrome ubiquinol oxidase subunit I [Sphingomonas pollutisoli]SDA36944.1 cytochrome bd-I ubiquinol oxidase subunit 1 apoprotein [Sphingomonas sp. NFR15]